MDTKRNFAPLATLPSGVRLENFGFGSTLIGMAVAVLAVAIAPALNESGLLADWMESCTTLVTIAWPFAAAAMGLTG